MLLVTFSPDGTKIEASAEYHLALWALRVGCPKGPAGWVLLCTFSRQNKSLYSEWGVCLSKQAQSARWQSHLTGATLASGSRGGTTHIWDVAYVKESELLSLNQYGHFSLDGGRILSGSEELTVFVRGLRILRDSRLGC